MVLFRDRTVASTPRTYLPRPSSTIPLRATTQFDRDPVSLRIWRGAAPSTSGFGRKARRLLWNETPPRNTGTWGNAIMTKPAKSTAKPVRSNRELRLQRRFSPKTGTPPPTHFLRGPTPSWIRPRFETPHEVDVPGTGRGSPSEGQRETEHRPRGCRRGE